MEVSSKNPAKFLVDPLNKQTKPGAPGSGPAANVVRFGELRKGMKPSSRLTMDRR
jgi:hypothetical protein